MTKCYADSFLQTLKCYDDPILSRYVSPILSRHVSKLIARHYYVGVDATMAHTRADVRVVTNVADAVDDDSDMPPIAIEKDEDDDNPNVLDGDDQAKLQCPSSSTMCPGSSSTSPGSSTTSPLLLIIMTTNLSVGSKHP